MTRAGVGGRAPSGSWPAEDGSHQSQSQRRVRRPCFGSICRKRNSDSEFYTRKVTQLYCTSLQVWRAHPLRFEACYRNRFAVISNIKSIKLTDSKFWAFAGCYQEMFLRDGLAWEMVEILVKINPSIELYPHEYSITSCYNFQVLEAMFPSGTFLFHPHYQILLEPWHLFLRKPSGIISV